MKLVCNVFHFLSAQYDTPHTPYITHTLHHTSLVPRPARHFGCTKERGGPGMFPHVRDVEGSYRKVVERT